MHEIEIKVRFCETDALGHVNNSSYFIYLEEARIAFIEELGQELRSDKWHFILASVKCDFIQQAFFNQRLTIQTFTKRIGNKSFTLNHHIIDSKTKELVAKGEAIMVCFDFEKQSSVPLSDEIKNRLESTLIF